MAMRPSAISRQRPCSVVPVCRPLAKRNGLYVTHMRDEGDHVIDSLEETFRIGRELGVPVLDEEGLRALLAGGLAL